ncbi:hypothetical protein HanIR_Chr17g0879321 [Helianthus annuus]|nr:hypothetical protein HanIR_Chr17g0879321 [Helianthus annuus]
MFYLKLLACYLICFYLFSFDLVSICVTCGLTLNMLYLILLCVNTYFFILSFMCVLDILFMR